MRTVEVPSGQHRYAHTEVRAPIETIIARVVYWVFGVIEALIALRFILLLLGANRGAGFVAFIYAVSGIFMAPFIAVFPTPAVAGSVFEWSALLAIVVYALIAWAIVALIRAASPREYSDTVEEVEHRDTDITP